MPKVLRLTAAVVVAGALGHSASVPAQQAVLRGRVVRADDASIPIDRVRIGLPRGAGPSGRVFTDRQGRFEIDLAEVAGLTLTVAKPGFVPESFAVPGGPTAQSLEIRLAGGAALSGHVIDSAGRPVRLSAVRVQALARNRDGNRPPAHRAVTNDLGEFRISGLAGGRYEVTSSFDHDGKDRSDGWQPSPLLVLGGPATELEVHLVDIPAGQDLFVTLTQSEPAEQTPQGWGGSVINGTVFDDFGLPAEGLRVHLWQLFTNGGQTTLREIGIAPTDDRGQYRLFDLAPGKYFVGADDPSGVFGDPGLTAGAPVFYPAAPSPAEAQPLDLERDQEIRGVNVTFQVYPRARLHGLALDAAGQPYRGDLSLATPQGLPSLPPRRAAARNGGAFEFVNIPPGDYVLRATVYRNETAPVTGASAADDLQRARLALRGNVDPTTLSEFFVERLRISGDDVGPIRVQTVTTSSLAGRVVLQGIKSDALRTQFALAAGPADPDSAPEPNSPAAREATVDDDWSFEIRGVAGPSRLVLRGPAGWWLKSIQDPSARDAGAVIDVGSGTGSRSITVVLAPTAATVSGRVLDERAEPAHVVIVFAADDMRWFNQSPYVRVAGPTTNKRFTVPSIPPGRYFIAALDLQESDASNNEWWRDPEFLRRVALVAGRITLSEGDVRTADLRLIAPPR